MDGHKTEVLKLCSRFVFVFFHGILNGFLDGFLWDFGNFRLDRLGRNWGLEAANWNLGASLPELLAIARRATQEHYVEVALEKLKETWSHSAERNVVRPMSPVEICGNLDWSEKSMEILV